MRSSGWVSARAYTGLLAVALFIVCAALAFTPATAGADPGGDSGADRPYFTDIGQFNYAKFLMHEGEFKVAAREFERLIEEFPASPLLPEAQFRMSEAYINAGLFREAEMELRLFIKNFSESPFAPQAVMLLGAAREKLRERRAPRSFPPGVVPFRRPGIRAVQVMFFDGRSPGDIARELRVLKNSGIDTIIVRVFHNRGDRFHRLISNAGSGAPAGGVYFKTSYAPVVGDLLPVFTRLAHREGLKIFAWMTTRYADYGIEERADLACTGYDLKTGQTCRCAGLDVFNDAAVEHMAGLYRDLGSYDIDGVLFQDDLVLRHNEGFGPRAEEMFRKETGLRLTPDALYLRTPDGGVHYTGVFWRWARWKNDRLLYVADTLRRAVRERNPDVKFAINLMYENLTTPPYALAWLSQDLEASKRAGFDYYSIMAYHRQMARELEKGPEAVRAIIEDMAEKAASAVGDPGRVLIKFQTVDWTTGHPLPDSEVVELIREVESTGVSMAVVPYRPGFPFFELGRKTGVAGAVVPDLGRVPRGAGKDLGLISPRNIL